MPTIRPASFELPVDQLLKLQGTAAQQPAVREAAEWACAEAARLAHPVALFDWFPVEQLAGGGVRIGGSTLDLGIHADVFGGAVEALVAVMTVGVEVEAAATALMAGPQVLRGFLLQAAADLALGAAGAPLAEVCQDAASARGWGMSLGLAPGSLNGWSLRQQATLCNLLDLSAVGVTVTPAGALLPAKSASLLVGIGPTYHAHRLRRACCFCGLRQTCPYRDE